MAKKLNFFGSKKLNQSNAMPQMESAFSGWEDEIILIKTTSSVVDGDKVVTTIQSTFRGVIQPLNLKAISLKPEGQRSWQWYQVHCGSSEGDLDVDDILEFENEQYKIMGIWPYSRNGFREYHAVKDFE